MIYNVFSGTLSLTQSINQSKPSSFFSEHRSTTWFMVCLKHRDLMWPDLFMAVGQTASLTCPEETERGPWMVRWIKSWLLDSRSSVRTCPSPDPGPFRSIIASVRSRVIFWTRLGPRVASAPLFCSFHTNHTSHQPQKKKVIDVTTSMGWIFYVIEW